MLPVFAQTSVDLNSNKHIEVKGYEILANRLTNILYIYSIHAKCPFSIHKTLILMRALQKIERQQHEKTLPAI
jgi:hypothetical protein